MADAHGVSGTRTRGGFFAMPSSVPGRVAALFFIVAVTGIAVMAVVAEPAGVAWRGTLALLIVASIVIITAAGLVAIIVRSERSWAVIVPTVFALGLLLNELPQYLRNLL